MWTQTWRTSGSLFTGALPGRLCIDYYTVNVMKLLWLKDNTTQNLAPFPIAFLVLNMSIAEVIICQNIGVLLKTSHLYWGWPRERVVCTGKPPCMQGKSQECRQLYNHLS